MLEVVDCSRRELLRLATQESEDILDAGAKQGALTLERESSHGATMLEAANPAPERPRPSQLGPMARTSTTKAQGLVEFFTQAEGKCNWIPIDAPHKTPSRYMEFFPPSSTQAPDAEIITPTATSSGNSSKKSRVRKEPSKPCALCTHPFPVSSLEAVVSRQAIYRLRQKWAKQTGTKDSEIVEKKFRFRLYDELRVCLFCSQLFNDYGASSDADDEASQPRHPKSARPTNHEEPIIVTVVGKARLEEIFFDKLAINGGKRNAHKTIKTTRAKLQTPDLCCRKGENSCSSTAPNSAAASSAVLSRFSNLSSPERKEGTPFSHRPSPPSIPKPIRTPVRTPPSRTRSKAHPHLE